MARDYQRRANPKSRKEKSTSLWKWLLVGLLAALFITFLFYLEPKHGTKDGSQLISPSHSSSSQRDSREVKKAETIQVLPKTKPRFEFYTKLPEIEVIIPESEIAERRRAEKKGAVETRQYIIQAGSFRQYSDADRRKAQLAMLGEEPRIETIKIGSTKWNRVLIGPFSSMRKIDGIRSRLRKNKIDSVVVISKR